VSLRLSGCRIGLLTASASSLGGGVAQAVAAQAAMIRASGADPVVFALDDGHGEAATAMLAPTPLVLAAIAGPRQVGFAPDQLRQLLAAELDLLHLHGIWMHPSRVGGQWARATGRPYLISPHGMLDPWILARGRWKKAVARLGYERTSWARAAAFHALTPREARDIAASTGHDETLVIPNAGPACSKLPVTLRPPEILYLGRIHSKKNLAGLIAGWQLAHLPKGARLNIAGWGDEQDVADLQRQLALANDGSIVFHGPAFGSAKQRLLETARFLILPTFSEGLPMVVLEAWAAGTPALMSEGCNLPEGLAANAAMACDTTPEGIARTLEQGFALDKTAWLAMAAAAQGLAGGAFCEATIARRWEAAYASLLAGQPSR
jgi:glycosyltransferase involved in cell wall biosynthesis